ncbi:hypothetical protein BD626DRAFT_433261 [Schizophyllum amplum]|uniref:Arrestin C-terminal-like domain-containing protein n=1 Tax=Schizophyllum amplum TaxID=97359 RepID=A0A550CC51_9AGAR|nr:hypothetical protein BD626DRAFT_433261 [Auriculariopsis ampla]
MPNPHSNRKSHVHVRLNESALFLRVPSDPETVDEAPTPAASLRGLLIVHLTKPARISSIDVELVCTSQVQWPDGFGTHHTEYTDAARVYHQSQTLFKSQPKPRRASSVGPGIFLEQDDSSQPSVSGESGTCESIISQPMLLTPPPRMPWADVVPSPPYTPTREEADDYFRHHPPQHFPTESILSSSPNPMSLPVPPTLSLGHIRLSPSASDRRPSPSPPQQASPVISPAISPSGSKDSGHGKQIHHAFHSHSTSRSFHIPHLPVPHIFSSWRQKSPKVEHAHPHEHEDTDTRRSRSRAVRSKSKPPPTTAFDEDDEEDEAPQPAAGWKEFPAGTYTYPISFTVPGNAPPSLETEFGSVAWKLNATVERQGAFTTRLHESHTVTVITCPAEDDTEDTANIIVERSWHEQLQYSLTISARSFYIGSTVPFALTLLPLTKIRIHRIALFVEEHTVYLAHQSEAARTDPVLRVPLIMIKHEHGGPILPLDGDVRKSPLLSLAQPSADAQHEEFDALAGAWTGPGPWRVSGAARVPNLLRPSNRNRRAGVLVTHAAKFLIRVESDCEVDPKTGRRKLYDVTVQTPVQVFSSRCEPDAVCLPEYSPGAGGERGGADSSDVSIAVIDEVSADPRRVPSLAGGALAHLFGRNAHFERLIAGQESESGEAPPAYNRLEGQPLATAVSS